MMRNPEQTVGNIIDKMNIKISNTSMVYSSGKKALNNISMEIESPNMIGLLGPNGAGKTTLMKLLVAEILQTEGEILLNDAPLIKQEHYLKSKLGYLPQIFGLYEELTVWQFLDYMAALKGISHAKPEIEKVIMATNLAEKKKAKIKTLSGGLRQRVGIAQALLGDPEILIFDEPTVGLDPEERINFRNYFSKIAENKIVLLSTHIIEDIQSVCNRLIVLHKGEIHFNGKPEDLIKLAYGHVGILACSQDSTNLRITARMNTAKGVFCRVVSDALPKSAEIVEPTLEDAYIYLITRSEG